MKKDNSNKGPAANVQPAYVGTTEAAAIAGVCPQRIRQLLDEGKIPGAIKLNPRAWSVPREEAEALRGLLKGEQGQKPAGSGKAPRKPRKGGKAKAPRAKPGKPKNRPASRKASKEPRSKGSGRATRPVSRRSR